MFPPEMVALPQWVVASVTFNQDGTKRVMPLNPRTLHAASVSDPRTWGIYEEALACAQLNELHLGFNFTEKDGLAGIDLDNPTNDIQAARHKLILEKIDTYTETSVSGKGVHLIIKATIPHAVKRDHVEIYDRGRFFIMTGKVVPGRTLEIVDHNEIVNQLVKEMGGGQIKGNYIDRSGPPRNEDKAVIEQCTNSSNKDKFEPLWKGQWQGTYVSQSEADYALINMLAFATPNDDQCRCLFRVSGLGQRKKAQRDDYLNTMIGRIRDEQNPVIDFSQFKPPAIQTTFKPSISSPQVQIAYPGGLVGEMAQYILDTAIRPVPQVALAGALGLIAGIAGRSYNISHTGLNLYLMLVAGTAIGKEGAAQGISRLIKAVIPRLPAIQQFIGPTEYASGQGMIRQLSQFPCQVSVLSEFGHTLKRISRPDAIGADIMWRKVLLDVYNKSGAADVLGSMVYSDAGKNTPSVNAPCLTLLTESSPASLYEGLDEQSIEVGLVPRFLLLECTNKRPPTNPNAFIPPTGPLVTQLEALAHRCLSMEANTTHQGIGISGPAITLLSDFDIEVDAYINEQNDDSVRQIWSRAHLKALRVSGLLAVGLNPDSPTVLPESAQWAIDLVRQDAKNMLQRFGQGVGSGDPVQLARLRHVMVSVLQHSSSKLMKQHNVVIHRQLSQRVYALACFRQDRRGAGEALRRALQALVDGGEIIQLSPQDTKQHFSTTAKCYVLTDSFTLT